MKFGLSKDSPRYLEHTPAYFQLKYQTVLKLPLDIKSTYVLALIAHGFHYTAALQVRFSKLYLFIGLF